VTGRRALGLFGGLSQTSARLCKLYGEPNVKLSIGAPSGDRTGTLVKRRLASVQARLGLTLSGKTHTRKRLLGRMPPASTCAEIGVWKGDFSAGILAEVKPKKLHLIDPWKFFGDPDHSSSLYGGSDARNQTDMDAIYAAVRERFHAQVASGTVVVHRQKSSEAAQLFPPDYFDWVYIDGDHQYEAVQLDLELYGTLVRQGGFICGDDYVDGGWWRDGVIRAVDDFVASGRAAIVSIKNAQFILRRTS
jgi:hypothetical protein